MTCWLCGFKTTELATNAKAPTCENGPCQICIAVAKVDEEINQAVATLRRLIVKRCDLRSEQNRVHGGLIHRLPLELKNYIFELLLPLRDEWGEIRRTERTVMPSYLGSICRVWRDIAWSNPSLWSTIHIVLGPKNLTSDSSSQINSVKDWILRSQTLPLRIVLHDSGGSEDDLNGIINVISQCSNRWHSLSLDIRWRLRPFPSDLQCHLLKTFRIIAWKEWGEGINSFLSLNPTASPEKIEIRGIPFQSLQISWNHVTSATITSFDLEEITKLFQHSSQMTCCRILTPRRGARSFSMPPILHHRLKTLNLHLGNYAALATMLLGSLTLPNLQEFSTNAMFMLTATNLPALVHRSSCPLTRLAFRLDDYDGGLELFNNLQPLPGVTDLLLETLDGEHVVIEKLLLHGYFPDLCHLTLRVEPFLYLWDMNIIIPLLGLKRPLPDGPNEGRLSKFLVIDEASEFDSLRDDVWEGLRGLNISLREGGFEFL